MEICPENFNCIYPYLLDSVIINVVLGLVAGVMIFKFVKSVIEALPVV